MISFRSIGLIFILMFTFQISYSQFVENFLDGDFTQNPTWIGNESIFIVNAEGELQLNDLDVSKKEAYLSVNASTGLDANWKFSINLDFSPSSSNFARVYLNASISDLTQSLDGYFIQIGGVSGDQDAVDLIKQSGNDKLVLLSGKVGGAAIGPIDLNIDVNRDINGIWNLQVDYGDGQGFIDEGSVLDTEFNQGEYFGMVCNYTSTRVDAFTLDDILIEPIVQDLEAPNLESLSIISKNQLLLTFNEAIDFSSLSTSNFQLSNGINIENITSQALPSNVLLNLSSALTNGTSYTLELQNISDLLGNTLVLESTNFTYTETVMAGELDILINEFMADPTPQVALPNAEFIELYNNSTVSFQLSDYTLASGSTPVALPDFILGPNEYVVLTNDEEAVNFEIFGAVLGLASFPSLTNSSDEITLQDANGSIVHQIFYNTDWYRDEGKEDGGYSIELINPAEACKGAANYIASVNLGGGTPAIANSVLDNTPDLSPPNLVSFFTQTPNMILLTFDEILTDFGAEEVLNYKFDSSVSLRTAILQTNKSQVQLELANPLVLGEIYSLQFENIADCLGNTSSLSDTIFFGLPEIAQEGDLLINEILFNPVSGGVDFVEIYNPTDRIYNLADLQIGNLKEDVDAVEAVNIDYLIFPQTYVCLTKDKSDILSRFPIQNSSTIFESSLPRFDDKEGNVSLITLVNSMPIFIDIFDYRESMHTGFISDKNGVSLERISISNPTNTATNWTSAAQSTGFATPGYKNSQSLLNPTVAEAERYDIVNPTFSPDQDGYKDFLQVNFKLDRADYFASMVVYDREGREIKRILPYQTIAPSSTVIWDGTDADGMVSSMGIYILWIQMLSPDGDKKEYKEPIVVARRLN